MWTTHLSMLILDPEFFYFIFTWSVLKVLEICKLVMKRPRPRVKLTRSTKTGRFRCLSFPPGLLSDIFLLVLGWKPLIMLPFTWVGFFSKDSRIVPSPRHSLRIPVSYIGRLRVVPLSLVRSVKCVSFKSCPLSNVSSTFSTPRFILYHFVQSWIVVVFRRLMIYLPVFLLAPQKSWVFGPDGSSRPSISPR